MREGLNPASSFSPQILFLLIKWASTPLGKLRTLGMCLCVQAKVCLLWQMWRVEALGSNRKKKSLYLHFIQKCNFLISLAKRSFGNCSKNPPAVTEDRWVFETIMMLNLSVKTSHWSNQSCWKKEWKEDSSSDKVCVGPFPICNCCQQFKFLSFIDFLRNIYSVFFLT